MQAINLFMYNIGVSRVQTKYIYGDHMLWLGNWSIIRVLEWSTSSLSAILVAEKLDGLYLSINGIQVGMYFYALCIAPKSNYE